MRSFSPDVADPQPTDLEVRIVYLLGTGHCGSTLLDLLLNAHPRVLGLSEIEGIGQLLRARDPAPGPLSSPLWRAVRARYETRTDARFDDVDLALPRRHRAGASHRDDLRRWGETNRCLFECLALESRRPVLVDASKSAIRLAALVRWGGLDLRVLHVVRDGRAVLNAYRRKYGSFSRAFRSWSIPTLRAMRARRLVAPERWLRFHYEDLASDPAGALRGICRFVGIEYEPRMLDFRAVENLGIGGNRMQQDAGSEIVLDDAWRQELPFAHTLLFELLGGALNRAQGYPRPALLDTVPAAGE